MRGVLTATVQFISAKVFLGIRKHIGVVVESIDRSDVSSADIVTCCELGTDLRKAAG